MAQQSVTGLETSSDQRNKADMVGKPYGIEKGILSGPKKEIEKLVTQEFVFAPFACQSAPGDIVRCNRKNLYAPW